MADEFEMPFPNSPKSPHDLDLGDGHYLDWTTYKGSRCGGIITHTLGKSENGLCSGSFWIDERFKHDTGGHGSVWQLTGPDSSPTLSPSFLCHCGDHGWVRDGKWVRA